MTEAQWIGSTTPLGIANFLRGRTSDRKLRLYACACARWTWDQETHPCCVMAVETAERFADDQATLLEMQATFRPAQKFSFDWARQNPGDPRKYNLLTSADTVHTSAFSAALSASLDAGWTTIDGEWQHESPGYAVLVKLAHDVFGNPFRSTTLDPKWITDAVSASAKQMYETRDFSPMPILADALQDAGCDDAAILDHCRNPNGVHVRGCWVVDLLLGRD